MTDMAEPRAGLGTCRSARQYRHTVPIALFLGLVLAVIDNLSRGSCGIQNTGESK